MHTAYLVCCKQFLYEIIFGRLHKLDEVYEEDILVPVHKPLHVVGDHAGVVVDHKPGTHIIISLGLKTSREYKTLGIY